MADVKTFVLVCATCRGVNIQCLDWVDANSSELIGGNDDPGWSEKWCEDCDSNRNFESVEMTEELRQRLVKRARGDRTGMRVSVNVDLDFDGATITPEDAAMRVRGLVERALLDHSGILTDGGAVIDRQGDVEVTVDGEAQ